ncbi:MAG: short-chain dehydrogenase [Gammaproteobacteria bacterium]|nr:short-chain dehydrogenase [Gammaproteobacteria bacterium]MBJ55380.1 short-chain dehydrogenase [Gammaproteobacteria bacterium]HBN13644.1 short-chain dehydrogenase [Pseudohongiella sp.]|tara:strand:- start:236 stop:955 length:720 start_codon:yes stop_codon:yes gene_type:complete
MPNHIAIFGANGTIGSEFTRVLSSHYPDAIIHAFSRRPQESAAKNITTHQIDYLDEAALKNAAKEVSEQAPLDLVIVATGILHTDDIMPEKSLRDLSADKFMQLYQVNTIVPALIAKYFVPILNKQQPALFAALSARVGSISDNHLGGWYSYRASKAALNMIIRNVAIETRRTNKNAIICALHPGTVDSALSEPFQKNVPEGKLFTAEFSVSQLLQVIDKLSTDDSGKIFAWDGSEIQP